MIESRKAPTLKNQSQVGLNFTIAASQLPGFFQFLQRGFRVRAQVGCTIKSMLCRQFGLDPVYVEERIKTVFMDGKAVDDMDSAVIKDSSTLALSAAMPGLVGATFRRG